MIIPVKVRISAGVTLNLGNYNSARISVELESEASNPDIVPEPEEVLIKRKVDELYAQAENEVIDKIATLITRLENEGYIGG